MDLIDILVIDILGSLMAFLIWSIPVVILFSIIFLILKHIFKVRNRNVNAIITLVISLAIIFLLAWILSGFGLLRDDIFIFPWTDCMQFASVGCIETYCPPDGGPCEAVCYDSLTPLICRIIQMWEHALIVITALIIIAPYLYHKVKDM